MTVAGTVHAPSCEELVVRAAAVGPTLREYARWHEDHRRLHEETLDALRDAGMHRLTLPRRYGGYECDLRTQIEVLAQIARADGATSWVAAVWSVCTWLVSLFPDEAQDEVFSHPDVRVSGILSPTAKAVPARGGLLVNGKWSFNSGARHAEWDVVAAMRAGPDDTPEPVMVIIPLSDLEIVDDWHVAGLKGTGSVSSVADGVLVPPHRVLPILPALTGQYASERNAASPLFRSAMVPFIAGNSSSTPLGIAKGALEAFLQRLPGRSITYTQYSRQAEAPVTHLQVAEAGIRIDSAEFHARRAAALVDGKAASGESWTVEERCRVRLDAAWVCRLAKEAVDLLSSGSGASSVYSDVPIQRLERDVRTINLHAMLNPATNLELYGRVLCGLEPGTPFI